MVMFPNLMMYQWTQSPKSPDSTGRFQYQVLPDLIFPEGIHWFRWNPKTLSPVPPGRADWRASRSPPKAEHCGRNPTPPHPDANFVDGSRAERAPDGRRCKT